MGEGDPGGLEPEEGEGEHAAEDDHKVQEEECRSPPPGVDDTSMLDEYSEREPEGTEGPPVAPGPDAGAVAEVQVRREEEGAEEIPPDQSTGMRRPR